MYLALWGMLFAAPVLSLYVHSMNDSMHAFDWKEVFYVWRQYGIFLVIFLIHNFLLAPLLVYRQRRWLYTAIMVCVLALFVTYQCTHRPQHLSHGGPHPVERFDRHMPPDMQPDGVKPDEEKPDREWHHPKDHRPPVLIGEHDIIATIILILMIGMNLDPSHLMIQGAEPIAAARALGEKIFYIHGKDARIERYKADVDGLLENLPVDKSAERTWNYVAVGCGRDLQWWKEFFSVCRMAGYNGFVSLEMEDLTMSVEAGLQTSIDALNQTISK